MIEDDADWDVALREQTPAIANAIRSLTYGGVGPWGFNWDYIALGHCGAGAIPDDKHVTIPDLTTGPAQDFTTLWAPQKPLPEHTRFVHASNGTVCTFGYAVTRHGARKLTDRLVSRGAGAPLDIDYAGFCAGGELACWAVTPEIIHHQRWTGHKITSGGKEHGALGEGEAAQKFTLNVGYSARCNSEVEVVRERVEGRVDGWVRCLPRGEARGKYFTR